jgi:hypothetical protein
MLNIVGINYGGVHLFVLLHRNIRKLKIQEYTVKKKERLRNGFGCDGDSFCI